MHHYIELILYKAYADLRTEAARAYLGVVWWVLEPLLYMTVFYLVFGLLLQRGGPGFISFLLCGLVTWRWFGNSINRGASAILSNSGLMMQVYLPKYLFPAIVVVVSTVKFLIVFVLLLAYLIIMGPSISLSWVALPVLLLAQLLWIAACVSVVAAVVPFVPDLKILIENGLMLLFFMSGIFYDIGKFPESTQYYFYLNPMATLIENYRLVLLQGAWPNWGTLSISLIASLPVLVLGAFLLTRYDRLYPKVAIS